MTSEMAVSEENKFSMEVISASEDEEGSDDEGKHNKLLEAISSLGGTRWSNHNERSEASLQVSEFFISAESTKDKVDLSDLLEAVENVQGAKKTKNQLKHLQHTNQTLHLPPNKEEAEKIQRTIAYEKTAQEVSNWQTIIVQNQKAEQLVFPLKQESSGPKRVEQVVAGWKAQTPLEKEIFQLLHMNRQPVHDPVLTTKEEASLKAMSLEEATIRRAELQKARALQSYYEAKAKRAKKIKSKKYHRINKRAKQKEYVKQFEMLMKTNPTEALDQLKKIEMSRMKERMTLKHQNSGKWAKSKAIVAKYDTSARQAMQEQLQINKDLTQKMVIASDDELETLEEPEAVPDFVNDVEPVVDSVNPWMRSRIPQEEPETTDKPQTPEDEEKNEEERNKEERNEEERNEEERNEEERNEEESNKEEELLAEFHRRRTLRQAEDDDLIPTPAEIVDTCEVSREEVVGEDTVEISDGEDNSAEEEDVSQFNALFRLVSSEKTREAPMHDDREDEELNEGHLRVRNFEDLEGLEEVSDTRPETAAVPSQPPAADPPPKKRKREIDLNEVLSKETKTIKGALMPTVVEDEEREEQISIIKEAFAGDDVISDFIKDKRKQEEAGRPKVVDLTLPGWGEWGGGGLKPSKRKRKRFRLKITPPPPRRDQKLPDVIISEKRNSSVAAHQVSRLPFPFQNTKQFEASIRSPIGQTWNTHRATNKMIMPKVVTTLGAIIEPLVKEDAIKQSSNKPVGKRPAILLHDEKKTGGFKPSHRNKERDSRKQQRNKP